MQPALGTTASGGLPMGTRKKPLALGDGQDMSPQSWGNLLGGLAEFIGEEMAEPEHAEDDKPLPQAAGVMLITPEDHALFVRYGPGHPNAGQWAFPGGGVEEGESHEDAARREAKEETGLEADDLELLDRNAEHGADYSTFAHRVTGRFAPEVNDEHDAHLWAPLARPPQPLHPGVEALLGKRSESDDSMPIWGGKLSPYDPKTKVEEAVDAFEESKHPRGHGGQFASEGSETGTSGGSRRERSDYGGRYDLPSHGGSGWSARELADYGEDKVAKVDDAAVEAAMDHALRIAMDRDSVRDFDKDGRLHVAVANISKANICPYVGKEIPGWEKLDLDPSKIYRLLRDPEELAKGAATFNGIQLLRRHEPVDAEDHRMWDIVGTTGTDSRFEPPYLKNSLHIWSKDGIDLVESGAQREISSGYHYDPDMTPGVFDGQPYDGVMRNIRGNHVALVKDGRAGPDVIVGDSDEEVQWAMIEAALMEVGLGA